MNRRTFLHLLAIGSVLAAPAFAANPDEIRLDYAYYNPVSLLLKDRGWVEEEFARDGIKVRWVLSLGSNKALEFLNGASIDFGSTAGGAALVGRANGNPIKAIYVYSRPEWTALVTRPDTGIAKVEDLKGKRVAVTRGTDPHLFLLQALAKVGLSEKDIKPVLLQHPDGATSLQREQVDAWAGLDPYMAQQEVENGAKLFHRAPELNTYGVLNVREAFAREHPQLVERLIATYERGRKHALAHPDELRAHLVAASKIAPEVAQKQLGERTDLSNPVLGEEHRRTLAAAGAVLREIGVLKPDVDVDQAVGALLDPSFVQRIVARKEARR
jgi:sulfonate transport system substrate-binding protein